VYNSRDLTRLPLIERHEITKSVLRFESPRVRIADHFTVPATDMLSAIQGQGLEGVVAKRKDSRYEAGKRSGAWAKYRLNSGQELVIGGYIPGAHGVDAIVVGDSQDRRDCSFWLSRIAYFNALLLRSRLAIALYEIRTGRSVKLF